MIVVRYEMEVPAQADALWRELNNRLREVTAVKVLHTALYEGQPTVEGGTLVYVESHEE